VEEIQRLRAEVDEKGKRLWTYGQIAEALGVSLTTVFRAAQGVAGYEGKKEGGGTRAALPKVEYLTKERKEQKMEFERLMKQTEEVGLSDAEELYRLEQKQMMKEAGVME
jgi:hypothetical protein